MSRLRIATLRRLVRVTGIIYRRQAAEVARLSHDRSEIAQQLAVAQGYLDADDLDAVPLHQLAVARASRQRQRLARADGELDAQLDVASGALAGFMGASDRLGAVEQQQAKVDDTRALDDVIDRIVRRSAASLE